MSKALGGVSASAREGGPEGESIKAAKRLDPSRPLDTWERYRALSDALKEGYDLMDIANREVRFALLTMGGLNAVLFVIGTRTELLHAIPAWLRPAMALLVCGYAVLAIYFLIQAVEILRPRKFRVATQRESALFACGIRYFEDILKRSADDHLRAWDEVTIGELNAELAAQGYSVALKNQAKTAALRRLFGGLRLMALLAGGFVTLLALVALLAGGGWRVP